ncbi:MAG: NAD(P)/FAD-dependent oxidoreductase, partial [Dongiaceae bacterium]
TGVELAGAIAELAHRALAADFRSINPREARIILVEAGARVLPAMKPTLSDNALRALEKLGVEVRLGTTVTGCDAEGVDIRRAERDDRIASECIIWAAGVAASPAAKWLEVPADRVGRVAVEADLSLPGRPEIFVIGDTALVLGREGKPLPGIAPAAKQQGAYVAKLLRNRIAGKPTAPFRYRHRGDLATIGRKSAVVDFGWIRLKGTLAWLLWSAAHIYFLIGFRNRLFVALSWLWAYATFHRGARLITGSTS